MFTLQIVSVTLARVDVNATAVQVVIPASNNPHGSVQLASTNPISTSEGAAVQLRVVRLEGLIGTLRVNFTALPNTANATDFSIEELCEKISAQVNLVIIR